MIQAIMKILYTSSRTKSPKPSPTSPRLHTISDINTDSSRAASSKQNIGSTVRESYRGRDYSRATLSWWAEDRYALSKHTDKKYKDNEYPAVPGAALIIRIIHPWQHLTIPFFRYCR